MRDGESSLQTTKIIVHDSVYRGQWSTLVVVFSMLLSFVFCYRCSSQWDRYDVVGSDGTCDSYARESRGQRGKYLQTRLLPRKQGMRGQVGGDGLLALR